MEASLCFKRNSICYPRGQVHLRIYLQTFPHSTVSQFKSEKNDEIKEKLRFKRRSESVGLRLLTTYVTSLPLTLC